MESVVDKFVLSNDRDDLVEHWFKNRVNLISNYLERVQSAAYGEIQTDETPLSIHQKITLSFQQATFMFLVAQNELKNRKDDWMAKERKSILRVAEKSISDMNVILDEISKIQKSVGQLVVKTNSLVTDAVQIN